MDAVGDGLAQIVPNDGASPICLAAAKLSILGAVAAALPQCATATARPAAKHVRGASGARSVQAGAAERGSSRF